MDCVVPIEIESILDSKARQLLLEMDRTYQITFEPFDETHAAVNIIADLATINYNPNTISTESVVHELLHLWCGNFNYSIENALYLGCKSDVKLSCIFNKRLCSHIGNLFDHYKMFPAFCSMGYDRSKFLLDGTKPKADFKLTRQIRLKSLGRYHCQMINVFIGDLLAIRADHVENDYSKHLAHLSKVDKSLFEIVSHFWKAWTEFDITKIDPIENSDRELVVDFIMDMQSWVENKHIV